MERLPNPHSRYTRRIPLTQKSKRTFATRAMLHLAGLAATTEAGAGHTGNAPARAGDEAAASAGRLFRDSGAAATNAMMGEEGWGGVEGMKTKNVLVGTSVRRSGRWR